MRLHRFLADRSGITALEYGLIVSALAFILVATFTALGSPISTIFSRIGSSL